MVSEVTTTASSLAASQQTTASQSNKLSQDFDDFLVLLTTQLQNQDPLSPMESTEFTNQLVQFSQVEQQINQNNKLDQMLALQLASTSTVALGYVGLDVSYIGDLFYTDGTGSSDINYALDTDAASTKVHIKDATTGEVIRTLDGELGAGNHLITWDGLDDNGEAVEPGNYRVTVDSLDKDGNAVATSTAVTGRVTGIESVNGVIQLLLKGDAIVSVSSVINAKEPKEPEAVADGTGSTDETTTDGGTDETDTTS